MSTKTPDLKSLQKEEDFLRQRYEDAADELAKANQYTMWVGDYGKKDFELREQLDEVRAKLQKTGKK